MLSKKEQSIIRRFVDGELKLSRKLDTIYLDHKNDTDDDIHLKYLISYMTEDLETLFALKKKLATKFSKKPSFERK